jgi:LPXTG-motif cell wall-anchored protein
VAAPPPSSGSELPKTGPDQAIGFAAAGFAFLLSGGALMTVARRGRR